MVVPLQVPGATELLVILLVLVIPIAVGYYVYRDATRRGDDRAALWGLLVGGLTLFGLLPGLVALAVYIATRG